LHKNREIRYPVILLQEEYCLVYDVSAVAHALDLELKQLDNLLSRNTLAGVEKKRRGLARRLTPEIAVVIRLAKELSESLACLRRQYAADCP
jgi:hypothetical protein